MRSQNEMLDDISLYRVTLHSAQSLPRCRVSLGQITVHICTSNVKRRWMREGGEEELADWRSGRGQSARRADDGPKDHGR